MARKNHKSKHSNPARADRQRHTPSDFVRYVNQIMDPEGPGLVYRTALLTTTDPTDRFAFVEYSHTSQEMCGHHFGEADRFGGARCEWCQATAWSPWWVAMGVFGGRSIGRCNPMLLASLFGVGVNVNDEKDTGTVDFIVSQFHLHNERVR